MTSRPQGESLAPTCILNGHSVHVEEAQAHIGRISGELGVRAHVVVTRRGDDISSLAPCVERSLYERGLGYNYDAVKVFMPAGAKQPVVVHYQEHVPADVGAAFIWLKNRDPERWRDAQQVEHALGKYIISDKPLTEEEWARERATVIDEKVVEELPAPGK